MKMLTLGITALVIIPMSRAGVVFWRASHAKEEAAAKVHSKAELPLRSIPVNLTVPRGVEPIASIPDFRDVAVFQEVIAVSARGGLLLYNRNGALLRWYRTGMELPAAELGAISEGMLAGSAGTELFIATRGEGLLAFNGERFRQICR